MWEGANGFLWVHWGAGARAERKTIEKQAKMGGESTRKYVNRRSKIVKNFILENNPKAVVLVFNYGWSKEILPNTCDKARAFNRRVKIECL